MLRTAIFFLYFWAFLIFSLFIYGFYKAIAIVFPLKKDFILLKLVKWWAKNILRIGGVRIKLSGSENIPKSRKVCFVSNHQSNYDIGIVISVIPVVVGFIAKVELKKYLPLRVWMDEIQCLFIDRKKPKTSLKKVKIRIDDINDGNALLIFPEGRRSKRKQIQQFKTGSLQMLAEKNIEIVPITIKNSYLRYENHKRITPGIVDVKIHQSINPANFKDNTHVIQKIKETITSGLED